MKCRTESCNYVDCDYEECEYCLQMTLNGGYCNGCFDLMNRKKIDSEEK